MASLRVPELGLQLEGSSDASTPVPAQAFPITLSDNVLEDMIKCVQKGKDIQLSLGSSPTFLYGNNSHIIEPTEAEHPLDIYLTKPFESTKQAFQIPSTVSLWKKPGSPRSESSDHHVRSRNVTSSSNSSALDSEIETLQNSIAAAERSKKHTNILETAPRNAKPSGRNAPKSKHLSNMASYGGSKNNSHPSSPALTAVGSPSLNQGYGVSSKQAQDKAKGQRTMIVHELAANNQPYDYLEAKWSGSPEDFKPTLEKVADFESGDQTWKLRRNYWKELDVWSYDYDTQEERQKVIDSAIKIFDRMRLGVEEDQWQKLLKKEDRGKGIVLSKVQANIAKGPPPPAAPKIKVQKPEDVASDAGEDVLKVEGGESTARSNSQPLPKKTTNSQTKRLLSTNKTKATPTPKASQPKTATKPRSTTTAASAPSKGGKMLSSEYISDSDSDDSENKPMASSGNKTSKNLPPPPVSKPLEKRAVSPASKPKTKPAPAEREPIITKKTQQPVKRRREDEDVGQESESSSSSGRPLAKRIKPKMTTAASDKPVIRAPTGVKQRSSVASSREPAIAHGNGNLSYKSTKNTSPTKSSPLASSPPTNASDLEHQRRNPPPEPTTSMARKRKVNADTSDDASSSRGSTASVDSGVITNDRKRRKMELVRKAKWFKRYYDEYAALHQEISSMSNPPEDKLASLLTLRERLKNVKNEIYRECPQSIAVA